MNEGPPNDYQQIETLFQQAADLSLEERQAYLDEHTPPGSEIRQEVESLLANLDDESLPGIPVPAAGFDEPGPDLEQLGPYRIRRKIGRGGMGVVYLAEDTRLHRHVAIKVLTALGARSRSLRARLLREAEAASKLDDPAICKVYEVGEVDELPYIAMQYVEGETLARRIARERIPRSPEGRDSSTGLTGRREIAQVLRLIEAVARALHSAHEAGLVHRDVKPANIMVTAAGDPILLDFGLARDVESETSTLTQTGQLMGTPAYMAPEQIRGDREGMDRRADVYALGITLYECLTHRRPFEAPTREQLYRRILSADAPDPRRVNRSLPRDLKTVLDTALEKDPERRYATAADFAEDLRRVAALEPITARPVSAVGRVSRWARRRPARAALVVVLAIGIPLLTALGGYVVANQPVIAKERERAFEERIERLLEGGFNELAHEASRKAITFFDAVLSEKPASVEAISGKALALLEFNQAQACLDFLDSHSAVLAREPFLQQLRFDALNELGREAESSAPEFKPRTALDHFLAGSRLMKSCQFRSADLDAPWFREAARHFQNAVAQARNARPLYHFQLAHAANHLATIARFTGRSDGPLDPDELCLLAANSLRSLWPKSADAWAWAGLALKEVNSEDGIAACRQAIAIDAGHARAWQYLGDMYRVKGQHGQALEAKRKFKNLVAGDPDRAGKGFGVLAWFYLQNQGHRDLPRALQLIRKAIELQPGNPGPLYGLAQIHMAHQDWKNAEGVFKKIVKLEPEMGFPRMSLAYCLLMLGKPGEAATEFERVLALRPDGFRLAAGYVNYGVALGQLNRPAEAIAMIEKGLRQVGSVRKRVANAQPGFPFGLAYTTLGTLYLAFPDTRDLEKAIAALGEARDLAPGSAAVLSRLGRAYQLSRDSKRAVAAFRKALAITPKDAAVWTQLALTLGSQKQWARSAGAFDRALELDPKRFRFHHLHGTILQNAGRPDHAIKAYLRAIQKNDSAYQSHLRIGGLYRRRGIIDRAIEHYGKAIELEKNRPEGHFGRGMARGSFGRYAEAQADFLRAKECGLDTPQLLCNIGLAHLRLGHLKPALDYLRRGHSIGTASTTWSYPSAKWLQECERMVALEPLLDSVVGGEQAPCSDRDQVLLAKIALFKGRFGASAALYQDAFESEPSWKTQRDAFAAESLRFTAACAAGLAGMGKGIDAKNFEAADRVRWRRQSLEWLHEELTEIEEQLGAATKIQTNQLIGRLKTWKTSRLQVLREQAAVTTLPNAERQAWGAFWDDVDRLIQRGR